jgi:hypothetical protein
MYNEKGLKVLIMLENYKDMVKKNFSDTVHKYKLDFAEMDGDEFFLIGRGFAIYIFVDRRDRRGDCWYISLGQDNIIRTHTLMYIQKERHTKDDLSFYGKPQSIDEKINSDLRVNNAILLNHCDDILSGDKKWLVDYPSKGMYYRQIAEFLAPFFIRQGYKVDERCVRGEPIKF